MTKPINLTEVLEASKARLEEGHSAIYREMHYEKLLAAFEASMALSKKLVGVLKVIVEPCAVEHNGVLAWETNNIDTGDLDVAMDALTAAQAHGIKE